MSDQELRKFFKFDEGDLAANRLGRLSERQRRELEESERKTRRGGIGIGVGLIVLAAIISAVVYFQAKAEAESFNRPIDFGQVIPPIVVIFLILGVFAAISFWIGLMKINTEIASVEGRVNFVKVEKTVTSKSATGSTHRRTVQVYELRVGNVNFQNVDEELLNIIEEGDTYAFYYLKEAKHILSAEFVSKGK